MGKVLSIFSKVWRPTLLFAVAAFLFEVFGPRGSAPLPRGAVTLYVLIVVPLVWWVASAKKKRVTVAHGALSGALCGTVLVLLPMAVSLIAAGNDPGLAKDQGDARAGVYAAVAFMAFATFFVAILAPVGACLGAVAALMQGRGDTAQ